MLKFAGQRRYHGKRDRIRRNALADAQVLSLFTEAGTGVPATLIDASTARITECRPGGGAAAPAQAANLRRARAITSTVST